MPRTLLPRRWQGRSERDVEVLTAPDVWAPFVVQRGDRLLMVLLAPDAHFDTVYEFEVTPEQFEVLSTDAERYYFLFGILARLFTNGMPEDRAAGVEARWFPARVSFDERGYKVWTPALDVFLDDAEVSPPEELLGAVFDTVLFGSREEVSALLDRHQAAPLRREVADTIRQHTGADIDRLRAGEWFEVGITWEPGPGAASGVLAGRR